MEKFPDLQFSDLQTSTRTVMVYSNSEYNFESIFRNIKITSTDIPLTKKKKNVDKKKLKAEKGCIINIQYGNKFRGVNLKKVKKYWCSVNCRLTKSVQEDESETKINTIVEQHSLVSGTEDTYETKYFCTNCEKYYTLKQLKKILNFLNQVSIVMSLGKLNVHIMMFKDNFKIAGCKGDRDAEETVKILWSYIEKIEGAYNIKKNHLGNLDPTFLFRPVMRNVDFKLGFFIDREELNKLMNRKEFNHIVFMSQCETTGHTNVNIKMYCNRPENYEYEYIIINSENYTYGTIKENFYKLEKRKNDKITFIVFSSSEIILSGRYDSEMERAYNFFIENVFKNKALIEEKIKKPNIDLESHLKK